MQWRDAPRPTSVRFCCCSMKPRGMQRSSHQSLEMCQVSVAIFVHLHHLNLHASHLSACWVGTVGGFGDETHLKPRTEKCQSVSLLLIIKDFMIICSVFIIEGTHQLPRGHKM